jgi:hypothetical protein
MQMRIVIVVDDRGLVRGDPPAAEAAALLMLSARLSLSSD